MVLLFLALKAARVNVQLDGVGLLECFFESVGGFLFFPHSIENAGFRFEIIETLFILDRSFFPLQAFVELVVVIEAPVAGFVESRPSESTNVTQLVGECCVR